MAPALGLALSQAHRLGRGPHRRDAELLPSTTSGPQAPEIDQPARTAQRGDQAPHPSGPHLPESGLLPAAGPGALRRDPRRVARRSPLPEYGLPQGAEEGPAASRSLKIATSTSAMTPNLHNLTYTTRHARRGRRRSSSARLSASMTPHEFIAKWRAAELKERSASQEHFIDLCRLLGEPTPAEADPSGEAYCFRARRAQGHRRRRLGRCLEAPPFRLGVQGQAGGSGRGVRSAPLVCAGAGESSAADRLRHAAVPDPHELDQLRQQDPRIRSRRPGRRRNSRPAQVGVLGPGAAATG